MKTYAPRLRQDKRRRAGPKAEKHARDSLSACNLTPEVTGAKTA